MKVYTRRRLLAALKLGLATIPFSVLLRLLHGLPIVPGTFLAGFAAGFTVGIAELFWLRTRFRRLGFLAHLGVKSLIILVLMYVAFVVLNLLDVWIEGIGWAAYFRAITEPRLIPTLLEALGVVAVLLFFVQLDRLLGPGVLLGYVTGRYHRPRREERIFMFLDLKGSTDLADSMEPDRYFRFLHRYFAEMSEPILATGAEVYQYVGDEVVLTWKMKQGLEEAGCVRVFFLIEDQVRAQQEAFVTEFGVAPEFKAGLHAGEVIVAEIGELKREVVYNGDVLNTAARIQALCNPLERRLLISGDLVSRLNLGPEVIVEDLGEVALRGKRDALPLFSITRRP